MDADLIYKIIMSILVFVLGWNFKKMWERITGVEKEMKEIKTNYLHRFEEVNRNINEGFTELKVLFAQYSTKLDTLLYQHNEAMKNNSCPVQHKHKADE